MKAATPQLILALFLSACLAQGQSQTRDALGKINFQALFDAAPAPPATAADAAKRAFSGQITEQRTPDILDSFYDTYRAKTDAARAVLQEALANSSQSMDAIQQRSVAQANASGLISQMGGVERMSQMSEAELQQATAQAAGNMQRSMSGAPPGAGGGGMQAMMQKMMSDPEYQKRFEKMSKAEQEAEMKKFMGAAPPPPTRPTAAETAAARGTAQMATAVNRSQELGELQKRIFGVDQEFAPKDAAIPAAPGGFREIRTDVGARIAKVPMIGSGELTYPDPRVLQPLQRELVTRERTRANVEIQQRTALFNQRKARYKEIAMAYTTWLRQNVTPTNQTAEIVDSSTMEFALQFEVALVEAAEKLAKYSSGASFEAANYEMEYQLKMREPLAK